MQYYDTMNLDDLLSPEFKLKDIDDAVTEYKIPEESWEGFMNRTQTMILVPKYKSLRDYLSRILYSDFYSPTKIPSLINGEKFRRKGRGHTATYCVIYLQIAIDLCWKLGDETADITVSTGYPICIDSSSLRIIIAPKGD